MRVKSQIQWCTLFLWSTVILIFSEHKGQFIEQIVDRSTERALKCSASASRSVTITAASPSTHEWSPYGSLGCEYGGRDDPLQHTQPAGEVEDC